MSLTLDCKVKAKLAFLSSAAHVKTETPFCLRVGRLSAAHLILEEDRS